MIRVWVIAVNTFREAVRNKLLYALVIVGVALIASGMAMGRLALDQSDRILQDFGLFFLGLFGPVIAVFVGVNLLYDEIQRRTILVLLAKPVRRAEFVLGKYCGILITLLVTVSMMGGSLIVLLLVGEVSLGPAHFQALGLAFVEVAVVAAVAIFFSAFSTPYLSGLFTFGVFVLGRLQGQLMGFLPRIEPPPLAGFLRVVGGLLPELHRFDMTARVVHDRPLSAASMLLTSGYGLTYATITLLLAMIVFARRDFQ